jgi:hypothetical protein
MTTNPYAPPAAHVEDIVPNNEAPKLWNPRAAFWWSLLFSPIFGATLQMKNWHALGEPALAKKSKMWVIACVGIYAIFIVIAAVLPDSKFFDIVTRGASLGLLGTWYSLSAKSQMVYMAARFGTTYPRRGWGKPILYTLLGFIVFIAIFIGIASAIDLLTREG